ncbi:MAG TPA: hypothetical protein VFK81_12815 [Terriglobales bacterium]|jgi:hypothetical protein|nr:hypothetical protein [Terriglobales bacterium]
MIQRLIAQGVLLAMLTGMLAPLAPAIVLPHACCLRHQQHCHMPQDAGISNRTCGHECCRFLAVTTALFAPTTPTTQGSLPASRLTRASGPAFQPLQAPAEHSGRAPPLVL